MPDTFGMELYELLSFLRQAGLAFAGAVCVWGFLFLWVGLKSAEHKKREILEWGATRLLVGFTVAFVVTAISWFLLWNIWPALAHQGITLYPFDQDYRDAFFLTFPLYVVWIVGTLAALLLRKLQPQLFSRVLPWFFAVEFFVISVLISLYAWTGSGFSAEQIFFYFHGFHSIFTLGTVLTLDFLFLSARRSLARQQYLFPFFPQISKIIYIGLGLDFLSALLVFGDAIEFSPRFFMAQTVVGIIIINGTMMAGPLTRKIRKGLKEGRLLVGTGRFVAGITGAISITSWTTITFIDYFPHMTFSYLQLMGIYLGVILFAIAVNSALAFFDERSRKAGGVAP